MARIVLDTAAEIVRLEHLTLDQLREEWRHLHQLPPPKRLSRDILLRGISYHYQERAFGGLSKSTLRKLNVPEAVALPSDAPRRASLSLKPGTRLIREWHGQTHTVVILKSGVEWQGRHYRSLSIVAREISGAHWSGPRFFGLAPRRPND